MRINAMPLSSLRARPGCVTALALVAAVATAHDTGPLHERPNVVLARFPTDPSALQPDIAPVVGEIIARHGEEEWKAALLTNELHRHLGIYSLVGVKMGIRAREVLDASLDDLRVESHAGLHPPVSCLTDGLQVSTGASLGRGTICVADGPAGADAVFTRGEVRLRLRLRPDILQRIRQDVEKAVRQHGDLTPEYFEAIRRLSIDYWLEMDRREIFLEELSSHAPGEGPQP
jgi:pyrimidine-specific ribonucleoside hydrolase